MSGKAVWNRHGGFRFHTASGRSREPPAVLGSLRPFWGASGRSHERRGVVGQTATVTVKKLTGTDAFVITDLPDAETADGVVRCARKVLQDGARTMARSRTYSWALLEQQISGASAGVNATDDRDAALRTFVDELSGEIGSGRLALDPGKGVTTEDLAAWAELDRRSPEHAGRRDDLLAAGIVAAADVAVGGVAGASVVIEGAGASGSAIAAAFGAADAEVVSTGDGPDVLRDAADVLVCGSRLGLVDHQVAATLPQRAVVPCGVAPVTAKGLAVATGRGIVVVPDFLSLIGPLLGFRPDAGSSTESLLVDAAERVRTVLTDVIGHDEGAYLGACYRAEAFLRTWQDTLPFGRPLA